jgi:hypothetical protein
MIYESAAITDYQQKSGGLARHGKSIPAEQPKAIAAFWLDEKSIQRHSKDGASANGRAFA